MGLLSLETLANVFVKATLIVKLHMCKHDTSCALEKTEIVDLSKSVWSLALQPLKTYLHYHNAYANQT